MVPGFAGKHFTRTRIVGVGNAELSIAERSHKRQFHRIVVAIVRKFQFNGTANGNTTVVIGL